MLVVRPFNLKLFNNIRIKCVDSQIRLKMQQQLSQHWEKNYESAIECLNSLQSNAQYIRQNETVNTSQNARQNANRLTQTVNYLLRSGLTLETLDKLSAIHVSGTKGKGTACSYSESILRHHGYKTGFYSSPHLMEVRERIRINGKPISDTEFASSFWELYDILDAKKDREGDMPMYFLFLTIMAFHVFLRNNVDVAILEVGIGGEFDSTNIIRNTPVVGITHLDLDHTNLLGNTIEEIAWHKAGIMKKGSKVFSVNQKPSALKILEERSIEKQCSLEIVKDIADLDYAKNFPETVQKNINLAMNLADSWIRIRENNKDKILNPQALKDGILNCCWPGRYEIRAIKNITYYIDGAHTLDSIQICAQWFTRNTNNSNHKKVLIFNLTGNRDSESLLKDLVLCQFDTVLFVPNLTLRNSEKLGEQYTKCHQYKLTWDKLILDLEGSNKGSYTKNGDQVVEVMPCVADAINYLSQEISYDVLVTGSIHLIGAVLSLIDPDLNGTLKS